MKNKIIVLIIALLAAVIIGFLLYTNLNKTPKTEPKTNHESVNLVTDLRVENENAKIQNDQLIYRGEIKNVTDNDIYVSKVTIKFIDGNGKVILTVTRDLDKTIGAHNSIKLSFEQETTVIADNLYGTYEFFD